MTDYNKLTEHVNKYLPSHEWTPKEDKELRQSCKKLGMEFLLELT